MGDSSKTGMIIGMMMAFMFITNFCGIQDTAYNAIDIIHDSIAHIISGEEKYSTVYITSNPSGAYVKHDEEYIGITPFSIKIKPETIYAISIEKIGYNTDYEFIYLKPGESRTIDVNLNSKYNYYIPHNTPTPVTTRSYTNEYFDRSYVWNYKGYVLTYSMKIPKDMYYHYKNLDHSNYDLAKYATEKYNRKLVSKIADTMIEYGREHGFTKNENVMMVVSFVQSLPYTTDKITTGQNEYVRYPIETLVDNGGDCEDSSILTAALLREMGYGVVILRFKDHAAVGVKGSYIPDGGYYEYYGIKYYYLETTNKNWKVGQIPDEYRYENARVIYVA